MLSEQKNPTAGSAAGMGVICIKIAARKPIRLILEEIDKSIQHSNDC